MLVGGHLYHEDIIYDLETSLQEIPPRVDLNERAKALVWITLKDGSFFNGCFISPQGKVITAAHCFKNKDIESYNVVFRTKDGIVKCIEFEKDRLWEGNDIVFIKPKDSLTTPIVFLEFSEEDIVQGDDVTVLTIRFLSILETDSDLIEKINNKYWMFYIKTYTNCLFNASVASIAAMVPLGSSGSPVLDKYGKLAGIIIGRTLNDKLQGNTFTLFALTKGIRNKNIM